MGFDLASVLKNVPDSGTNDGRERIEYIGLDKLHDDPNNFYSLDGIEELAEKMGVSQSRLSNLLNTQPNMTLETIAQFELALDVNVSFELESANACSSEITTVISDFGFGDFASSVPTVEFSGETSTAFSGVKNINLSGKLEVAAA